MGFKLKEGLVFDGRTVRGIFLKSGEDPSIGLLIHINAVHR